MSEGTVLGWRRGAMCFKTYLKKAVGGGLDRYTLLWVLSVRLAGTSRVDSLLCHPVPFPSFPCYCLLVTHVTGTSITLCRSRVPFLCRSRVPSSSYSTHCFTLSSPRYGLWTFKSSLPPTATLPHPSTPWVSQDNHLRLCWWTRGTKSSQEQLLISMPDYLRNCFGSWRRAKGPVSRGLEYWGNLCMGES